MKKKRINIFIGHFGSGKTEIALNFAKVISKESNNVVLVDLDIVNPFFRSSDVADELQNYKIKLIKPVYANSNIDVPALPPDIYSIFVDNGNSIIIDVGGDDLGARAVSCYSDLLSKEDYAMYFVVNTKRLFTSTYQKIQDMLDEIQTTTRLRVSHIVNNTNLLAETSVDDIISSNHIIKEVAKNNNIEFAFIAAIPQIATELAKYTNDEILVLDAFIKLPWNKD